MKLIEVVLRTYHVGFGDCFRLAFRYENGSTKHVLIDCGTTCPPPGKKNVLLNAAEDVHKACTAHPAAELTAVIATHRHRDHIDGFRLKSESEGNPASGDIIRSLNPKLVIQPWTEDPLLEDTAEGPEGRFVSQLNNLHRLSFKILSETRAQLFKDVPFARQLEFLGENNLKDVSAVNNLRTMGGQREYVYFGIATSLSNLLPGVSVHVLGPPTLTQSNEIRKQRQYDEVEFWHLWQKRVSAEARRFGSTASIPLSVEEVNEMPLHNIKPIFEDIDQRYSQSENPPRGRWFRRQLKEMRANETLGLVRILDRVLNNTSVILLFEFGNRKVLFPGDAQKENWAYALSKPEVCGLLAHVDLYKVGHHGSLNATPRTLWDLFAHKRSSQQGAILKTVVSTLAGRHGHEKDGTEVPRNTLITELSEQSDLFTTQSLESYPEKGWHDIQIYEAPENSPSSQST